MPICGNGQYFLEHNLDQVQGDFYITAFKRTYQHLKEQILNSNADYHNHKNSTMTQMRELGQTNGMTNDTPLDNCNRMKVNYPNQKAFALNISILSLNNSKINDFALNLPYFKTLFYSDHLKH